VKCILRNVYDGPLIILELVWRTCKLIHFWRRCTRKNDFYIFVLTDLWSLDLKFAPLVTLVQNHVSTKSEVSTAFLFRKKSEERDWRRYRQRATLRECRIIKGNATYTKFRPARYSPAVKYRRVDTYRKTVIRLWKFLVQHRLQQLLNSNKQRYNDIVIQNAMHCSMYDSRQTISRKRISQC